MTALRRLRIQSAVGCAIAHLGGRDAAVSTAIVIGSAAWEILTLRENATRMAPTQYASPRLRVDDAACRYAHVAG